MRQPPSIVESESGVIIVADGQNPVMRWDGYTDQLTPAGITPPTQTPVVTYSGTPSVSRVSAPIVGTYRAFIRFVDRFGNYSDPSPLSEPFDTEELTVSPPAETGERVGVPTIVYNAVPTPSGDQTTVVRRQILRNTDGQATAYYVDVDTDDLTSISFSSTRDDDELGSQEVQAMLASDGTALYNRFSQPPSTVSVLASHLGRIFGAGVVPYSDGAINVTNGSYYVTSDGALFNPNWIGRIIHIEGADRTYEIAQVLGSRTWVLLTEPYAGATASGLRYSIRPPKPSDSTIYYSEALNPEYWPADNAITVRESGGPVTSLIPYESFLYIAKRKKLYRLTADSDIARDGMVFESVERGCVSARSWAILDGLLYVMDEQGIYLFNGGTAEPIGDMIRDVFQPSSGGCPFAVNWKWSDYFHAVADPANGTVRFFVTINGGGLPRWAICYCPVRASWWLEQYPYAIGASVLAPSLTSSLSGYVPMVAGQGLQFWRMGDSVHDGPTTGAANYTGPVTSATALKLTAPGNVNSDAVGFPITIVSGRGAYQTRIIVAVSGATVTVDRPFRVIPDDTSTYAIGGITYQYVTDRMELIPSESRTGFIFAVGYDPQKWGSARLSLYSDHATKPDELRRSYSPKDGDGVSGQKGDDGVTVNLTNRTGYAAMRADRHLDDNTPGLRTMKVELRGVSGPSRHRFNLLRVRGLSG